MILVLKSTSPKLGTITENVFPRVHNIPDDAANKSELIEKYVNEFRTEKNVKAMVEYQKAYDLWYYLVISDIPGKIYYGCGIMDRVLKVYGPDHYYTKMAWNSYEEFAKCHPEPDVSDYVYQVYLENIIA